MAVLEFFTQEQRTPFPSRISLSLSNVVSVAGSLKSFSEKKQTWRKNIQGWDLWSLCVKFEQKPVFPNKQQWRTRSKKQRGKMSSKKSTPLKKIARKSHNNFRHSLLRIYQQSSVAKLVQIHQTTNWKLLWFLEWVEK